MDKRDIEEFQNDWDDENLAKINNGVYKCSTKPLSNP
jgi:hypothetical protein